jgi:hypothetical protein
MQTICATCRSALEEHVLGVRAADYPALFHNVVHTSAEPRHGAIDPTSIDMLKVAENTSDDLDLVPLVPMDEPKRGGVSGGTSGSASPIEPGPAAAPPSYSYSTATVPLSGESNGSPTADATDIAAVAPAPVARTARPAQTVYTPPAAPKLEPSSRWKHVIIAVLCLVAAAVLAAVLWSTLVPGRAADASDDAAAAAAPAKK